MGILGGCADNRVMPGKFSAGEALLICNETLHYMPDWIVRWMGDSPVAEGVATEAEKAAALVRMDPSRAHIEEQMRVRMDPLLNPGMRTMLLPEHQHSANKRLAAAETAHEGDDPVAKDEAKSAMMPRTYDRIKRGSWFFWTAVVTCHSALDEDTFYVLVEELLNSGPRVGGKQGTGHGLFKAIAGRGIELSRTVERSEDLTGLVGNRKTGDVFRAHVAERKGRIRSFFREVNA